MKKINRQDAKNARKAENLGALGVLAVDLFSEESFMSICDALKQ